MKLVVELLCPTIAGVAQRDRRRALNLLAQGSIPQYGNRRELKALPARFPAVIGVPIPNTKAFSHFFSHFLQL